jgi:hypothetical protein
VGGLASAVLPLFLARAPAAAVGAAPGIEVIGRMEHAPLVEVSGIARSERYPGTYWVHNDSGDEARIFAVDARGRVLFPPSAAERYHGETRVAGRAPWPGVSIANASNVDWEDIDLSDGRLFIADVGNNDNARRDLGIYVVDEPDPRTASRADAAKFLPVRYPEQQSFPPQDTWFYDCEAAFVDDGKVYLLTRHRRAGEQLGFVDGTRLYRLDTAFTDRQNVLTLVGSREDLLAVSAADLSPDGRMLAVLSYAALWVFERPAQGDRWLSGPARRLALPIGQTKQAEAVCWDDATTLRVANEQRKLFRIPLSALEPVGTPGD